MWFGKRRASEYRLTCYTMPKKYSGHQNADYKKRKSVRAVKTSTRKKVIGERNFGSQESNPYCLKIASNFIGPLIWYKKGH